MEFSSGLFASEVPFDGGSVAVEAAVPGNDFLFQHRQIRNSSPSETLAGQRLTNGFSKKLENHAHQIAVYFMHYNFCRVHSTLRVTPAMEAGLTDHVWTLEELCSLIPEEDAIRQIDKKIILKALENIA